MKILTGFKLDDVTMSDTFWAASIDTRQLHFTYMDVISTGKKINDHWEFGMCSKVACTILCWRKKTAWGLLTASA